MILAAALFVLAAFGEEPTAVGSHPSEPADDPPVAVLVTEAWGLNDWYDLEDAWSDVRQIQRGLEWARVRLRENPLDSAGLNVLAYNEYLAMEYSRAEKDYTRMTVIYPDDPAGWTNLALTFKRRGDYATEEKYYREVLARWPFERHARTNLALCLAHQGRHEEAVSIMDALERILPDDPYLDLHRAAICALNGDRASAYRFLLKSLGEMQMLDSMHDVEYRQDLRLDPAFEQMRQQGRFRRLLLSYSSDAPSDPRARPGR